MRWGALTALSMVGVTTTGAATIQVRLDGAATVSGAYVVAVPTGGLGASLPPARQWPIQGGRSRGELPPGHWRLDVDAPGVWTPGAEVFVSEDSPEIEIGLDLWEAASLVGELDEGLTGRISVTLAGSPGPDRRRVPSTESPCEVLERRFRCRVPAARLDVRVGHEGRVPHYAWGVVAPPGSQASLGKVPLPPGASVSGRVRDAAGRPAVGHRVTLDSPPGDRGVTPGGKPLVNPTELTDSRGFFQFRGAPLGDGVLIARSDDQREARVGVRVHEGRESALIEPLVLSETAQVRLVFHPAIAPDGSTWRLTLESPGSGAPLVADVPAPRTGVWHGPVAPVGRYELRVSGGSTRWFKGDIELEPEGKPIELDLSARRVHGVVRIGGDRLAAKVIIGGGFGPLRIPLESDEEGQFEGWIPETLAVADVLVDSQHPPVRRLLPQVPLGPGEVELALPSTSLHGTLVDSGGRPVRHAVLSLEPEETGPLQQRVIRDEEGRFRIEGLAAGRYRLAAETKGLTSDEQVLEVKEFPEESPELRVVMKRTQELHVRAVAADGRPVPAARLRAQPAQMPLASAPVFSTDASGRAPLTVPGGTNHLGVTGGAPGFAHQILRLPVTSDGDDLQFPLTSARGTLIVELVNGTGDDQPPAVLLHRGWFESVGLLQYFTNATPRVGPDGGKSWEFEGLAPGRYSLCRSTPEKLLALIEAGGRRDCHTGVLAAGASLTLAVP